MALSVASIAKLPPARRALASHAGVNGEGHQILQSCPAYASGHHCHYHTGARGCGPSDVRKAACAPVTPPDCCGGNRALLFPMTVNACPCRGRDGFNHGRMTEYHWRKGLLSPDELASLREIVDVRAPGLRPLIDEVLGSRLLTDDEIEPLEPMLETMMLEEPDLSEGWLTADHLIGRVDSQSERFWR